MPSARRSEFGLIMQVTPWQKNTISLSFSFGSRSMNLSNAGYGRLIAPGIVPSWKRGSGRESISTASTFAGPCVDDRQHLRVLEIPSRARA